MLSTETTLFFLGTFLATFAHTVASPSAHRSSPLSDRVLSCLNGFRGLSGFEELPTPKVVVSQKLNDSPKPDPQGAVQIIQVSRQWMKEFLDPDSAHYRDADKILLLSEHSGSGRAEKLAAAYPKKKIFKTDIEQPIVSSSQNLIGMKLDNSKKFPFDDNSFQSISMLLGLCVCHGGGVSCGGIGLNAFAATGFLLEVGRVLDKNNPKSVVFLHGEAGNQGNLPMWVVAADVAMKRRPNTNVQVLVNDSGEFMAFRITPIGKKRKAPK